MRKMFNLVRNEHEKIYSKKSIWGCYIFILIVMLAISIITFLVEKSNNGEVVSTFWDSMEGSSGMIGLVLMMVVVIGATNIASEFNTGTIKLLLIRPTNRWKVLVAKYLNIFIFTFEMMLFVFVIGFITSIGFFGTEGMNEAREITQFGMNGIHEFTVENMWGYLFKVYLYNFIAVFVLINMGLMISSLFRSNAAAIGLTLVAYFLGSMVSSVLVVALDQDWGKYILFSNLDLSVYDIGSGPMVDSMTLGFSVAVLLVHLAVFSAVTWYSFCKRDVVS